MTVQTVATKGKIRRASLRMDRFCCNDRLDAIFVKLINDVLNSSTIWILPGRAPLSGVNPEA
jgi:hypothetical protein